MKDRILIIIPCSERKRAGGEAGLTWRLDESAAARLTPRSAQRLLESRRALAKRYRLSRGKDLGGEADGSVPLLEACRRFDGNLYRKIDQSNWSGLATSNTLDVLIVSALYGLLAPREAVRMYDLHMERAMTRLRLSLKRWWSNQGLESLLAEYVRRNRFTRVHDFLSGSYLKVSDLKVSEPLYASGKDIRFIRHTYSGLGSGADHHRGKEVRELLEKYLP